MLTIIFRNRFTIFASILFVIVSGSLLTGILYYLPLNSLIIEVESPSISDKYQLFYDIGNGFRESDSVITFVEKSKGVVKVIFKIPHAIAVRIRNIRIDPGQRSGTICINKITLNHFFYRGLHNWSAKEIASSFLPINHISEFEIRDGYLKVKSVGEDPSFVSNFDFEKIYNATKKYTFFTVILFITMLFTIGYYISKYRLKLKTFIKNHLSCLTIYFQCKYMPFIIYSLLLSLIIFNIYIPHIKDYFFLMDDYVLVHDSLNNAIKTIFTTTLSIAFYRPLMILLMTIESYFWHFDNPHGYILVSIILHVFNSILLIYLVKELKFKINQGLLAASIFLLSPWSSVTYFWLACRFDIIATLFIMLALIYSLRALNNVKIYNYFIVFILSFFAYISKESAVTLPFIFIILGIRVKGIQGLKNSLILKIFTLQVLSLLVYFFLRSKYVGIFTSSYGNFFDIVGISNFIYNPFLSLNNYLLGPLTNNYWPHLLFLFSLFLIVYYALIKNFTTVVFFMVIYYVAIMPAVYFLPSGHRIYFPSIFICIILAVGMVNWFNEISKDISRKMAYCVITIFYIIIFSHMYDTINYQRKIWSESSFLAKESILQFSEHLKYSKNIYITN
ncbi:MAG: hypothetical protein JXB42_13255, partial [Deltaproteobacteria bacterium]|nr:hypothetical protein [Deltaproteobacteria bacterium]